MAWSDEQRWASCWAVAVGRDERIQEAHVRANLLPLLVRWGFTKPVMIGGAVEPAGPFPSWFFKTIFTSIRCVLRSGRPYGLEEFMRLFERTYGVSPGSVGRL